MGLWTNGLYQQAQPLPPYTQAVAQFSHNTMRDQQAGNANISLQVSTANTGVRPPQSANFTYQNEAHPSRQSSSASSCQHRAGENQYLIHLLLQGATEQHSPTKMQSGNLSLPATYGFQQNSHQNSAQTLYSPTNIARVKTTYPQQDMSAHWNQSVRIHGNHSLRIQEGNIPVQNGLSQNVHGKSTQPVSATSPPYEQGLYIRKVAPAVAHNLQAAYNHNNRQNGIQHGSTTIPSPAVITQVLTQHLRKNGVQINQSSSGQNLYSTSTSQKTLHYSTPTSNPSFNSNSYKGNFETNRCLSKANEIKKTQEEMQRCHEIARIEEYLRTCHPAGSQSHPQVYTGSHYVENQSNQDMQPPTSNVTESYNSNPSQSLPINSGQFLSKTTNSVVTAQQSVDVVPQQSSVPNILSITGDESGSKGASAFLPKNNGSLGAAQLIQVPQGISPQRNETQSFGGNERIEMLSVKTTESSMHSSPGRTRAVAVVQPLSYDSPHFASKQTCSDMIGQSSRGVVGDGSLGNPKELYISPKPIVQERKEDSNQINQMSSDNCGIGYSEVSNNDTHVPSLVSAGSVSKKQLCTDNARSEPTTGMQVNQHVAAPAQQSVTSNVPVPQNNEDQSEIAADPKEPIELSSLPTDPWTYTCLTKMIQHVEKAQKNLKESRKSFSAMDISSMFWHGTRQPTTTMMESYRDLSRAVHFLRKNVTARSVIISQVKKDFLEQLKNYHVLKEDEVYSELPYKSSWLNINEQLDDIDKEFGFPPNLLYPPHTLKSDSTPDVVQMGNGIPAKIPIEVSKKLVSLTEPEPIECEKEKDSTISPSKMQSDDSRDEFYTFEIQVLPPEEARVIFEQSKLQQSLEKDNQPEKVTNGTMVDEPSKIVDATFSKKEPKKKSTFKIEEICCISKWIEMISGSHPSLSNCECKTKQNPENMTDKGEKLCAIQSDGQLHSDEDNQVNGGKNTNRQVVTLSMPELCNELTENDDIPHSYDDQGPEESPQISVNRCQSSTTLAYKNLIRNETEMFCQMPDFESDSEKALLKLTENSSSNVKETNELSKSNTEIQPDPAVDYAHQLESTGTVQSRASVSSDTEAENFSSSEKEVASPISDLEEKGGEAQLTYNSESSLETEEITQRIATGALQSDCSGGTVGKSRKRQRSHDRFFPIFNKPKKSKSLDGDSKSCNFFLNPADSESSVSISRTVQLVLFGSTPKENRVSLGSKRSQFSSPEFMSYTVTKPPDLLTVKLSPLKIKFSETKENSVKHKIYEKWSRSFPPTKIRRKNKLYAKKGSFGSLSDWKLKKTFGPAKTEERTVTSEIKILNGEPRFCLSLKRRSPLNNGHKHKEEGKRITVIQPAGGVVRDDSLGNPKELCISPKQIVQERKEDANQINQMSSDKCGIGYSEVSNYDTLVPSLVSAGSDSKKQLCTDNSGSEPAKDMQVNQHVAPTAQQSVTSNVPVPQNDEDQSVMPANPKEPIELSSLPTDPWTYTSLTKMIQHVEKAQKNFGTAKTEERTVTSKIKILNGEQRFRLSLKRRRALNNGHKHKEKGKNTVIQPAEPERSQADNGRDAAMRPQSNDVLKFSVLPNAFNFQDRSHGTKKTTHPVQDKPGTCVPPLEKKSLTDKPDPVEEKDQSHKTPLWAIGTGAPPLEKNYHPLRPAAPKTSSLFSEYQKKYKEKMVPDKDE